MITTVLATTLLLGGRFLFRGGHYSTSGRPILASWVQLSINQHTNTPQPKRALMITTVLATTLLLGGRFLFRGGHYSTFGWPILTSWVQLSVK